MKNKSKMIGKSFVLLLWFTLGNTLMASNSNHIHDHSKASVDFQAVNSYLTQINPLNLEQVEVVTHLLEAIEIIESIGVDTLSTLNEEDNVVEAKFRPLLDGNIAVVLNILKNLVTASDCDEESRNFLLLIGKETFLGQFLNKYSQMMLNNCLKKHLIKLVRSFEKSAGKETAMIYELLDELATKMVDNEKFKHQRSTGTVAINEQGATRLPGAVLQAIKKLSIDKNLRPFALELNRKLNERLFTNDDGEIIKLAKSVQLVMLNKFYQDHLVSPCQDVTFRLDTTLGSYARYHSDIGKFVVAPELETMQKVDAKLDYLLEIGRICMEIKANKNLLWNMLKNMR